LLNFVWFAVGLGVLLIALCLCSLLLRLHRTLGDLERILETADESLRELVPEVRGSLGNVNDITAGVNLALRVAGSGAGRVGTQFGKHATGAAQTASAAIHGLGASLQSLWRSAKAE
jgi:uncharacterized protein YoxC